MDEEVGVIPMKKAACLLLVLLFSVTFAACEETKEADGNIVAYVNSEPVTEEEFEYFREKCKSEVLNDCLEKFSVRYTDDFWQTEFDGVTPEEILYERALSECVRAKIQFLLMKEEGIYEDITFAALKEKAEKFNEENAGKEGVVGIKSIPMNQFYSYYLQTGVMELQNIYADGKLKPDEKEIQDKIDELSDKFGNENEQDLESIAISRLKTEKYEKYIDALCEEAEVKENKNYGKQS